LKSVHAWPKRHVDDEFGVAAGLDVGRLPLSLCRRQTKPGWHRRARLTASKLADEIGELRMVGVSTAVATFICAMTNWHE